MHAHVTLLFDRQVARSIRLRSASAFVVVLIAALLLPAPAWGAWPHQTNFGTYRVHADFPVDRMASLFRELEQQERDVQATLKLMPRTEPIDVYLFARSETYRQYLRYYFPSVSPRPAMFIKTNSPGNVFAHVGPSFEVDLRHEATHAMLHGSLPMVPLWLDEGLAEYFEVRRDQRHNRSDYVARMRSRSRSWMRAPSLKRLESLKKLEQMGEREYCEAWAWVHFMIHGPPAARTALLGYFGELQQHSVPRPLSERLANDVPDYPKRLQQHFRQL